LQIIMPGSPNSTHGVPRIERWRRRAARSRHRATSPTWCRLRARQRAQACVGNWCAGQRAAGASVPPAFPLLSVVTRLDGQSSDRFSNLAAHFLGS
jgi:hypothetical protein